MKFKFKNHEDYLTQRNTALAEAEAALTDGDQEKYDERVQYVNEMDILIAVDTNVTAIFQNPHR